MLRNPYCVTKTLLKLIISLPLVSLFNNLCENTAALLTQSGGNPLILRRFLKINSYFRRLSLWQLNIQSTRLWRKFIVESAIRERQ